jgi:hypothetical protein
MLCYAYGINKMDSDKFLSHLYCGMDEDEAIRIAKERLPDFQNTVVKGVGSGGVLYHSSQESLEGKN